MASEPLSKPSIVNCDTDSAKNQKLYDAWASNYERDIKSYGYDLPERVAQLLNQYMHDELHTQSCGEFPSLKILDSGAGDGLSGVALRNYGFASSHIAANDISPSMLEIAKERGCYEEVKVVDLNKTPLPYSSDEFDAVTMTGALTYIEPKSGLLEEFVRITSPEGFICYTNRTDKLDAWKAVEKKLEETRSWHKVIEIGPIPYLPLNDEYGESVEVMIFLYQVTDTATMTVEQ